MSQCSFKKCKNHTSRTLKKYGISYFRFPRDPVRCREWISVVARQISEEFFKPTQGSVAFIGDDKRLPRCRYNKSMEMQIKVSEGILEGEIERNLYGRDYYSFKGIPYAEPPLGDLRFKAPRPAKPWSGVREAKEFGPVAYQVNFTQKSEPTGSEDCLYLNVYTPDVKPMNPLPVLFYVHGGAFSSGSGNDDNYGPAYLMRHDVILVTINYRLEVLGFLCLDTEEVPGNAGMKDQVAALRWVKKNIGSFGGDPENITVFGQSAGAASVSYYLVSPMTKGLFRRAIVQSGSCTCWWANVFEPRERALALAKKLGFKSGTLTELYNFLKSQPVENLNDIKIPITLGESAKMYYNIHYGIVSEKKFENNEVFFSGDVFEALLNHIHEDVEIIVGYTADEGILNFVLGFNPHDMIYQVNNTTDYLVPKDIKINSSLKQQIEVGRKLKEFYFENKILTLKDWERLGQFYSMEMFIYGIVQFAKLCSFNRKVYFYKMTCKSERNLAADRFGLRSVIGDKQVVCHCDDVCYIFQDKHSDAVDINSKAFKLIETVTKLWTNFATHGNPTPGDDLGVKWVPYTIENQEYLDLGNELKIRTAPDSEDIRFWEDIYEEYVPQLILPPLRKNKKKEKATWA